MTMVRKPQNGWSGSVPIAPGLKARYPGAHPEHSRKGSTPPAAYELFQLIKPVVLSNVKLGWVPFGVAAFRVKLDGELTLIVNVTPLVFL